MTAETAGRGLRQEPEIGDAIGALYQRCWRFGAQRDVAIEIVERDDGFAIGRDAAIYFDPPEDWPKAERAAVEASRGRVLDVGCGPGRHALATQRAGLDTVAVDSSPLAIEVAVERGVNAIVGDFTDLPADLGTFDTFLLLGNNISLLGSPDGSRHVLERLAAIANPGATLHATGLDVPPSPERIAYETWNVEHGRPRNQVSMRIRDRRLATPWFDFLMLGPDDVAGLVAGTPWRVETVEVDGLGFAATLRLPG